MGEIPSGKIMRYTDYASAEFVHGNARCLGFNCEYNLVVDWWLPAIIWVVLVTKWELFELVKPILDVAPPFLSLYFLRVNKY